MDVQSSQARLAVGLRFLILEGAFMLRNDWNQPFPNMRLWLISTAVTRCQQCFEHFPFAVFLKQLHKISHWSCSKEKEMLLLKFFRVEGGGILQMRVSGPERLGDLFPRPCPQENEGLLSSQREHTESVGFVHAHIPRFSLPVLAACLENTWIWMLRS